MAVVLDTTGMAPAQRAQAMEEFFSGESLPTRFECSRALADMDSWCAAWDLDGLQFVHGRGAGMRGIRTKREVDKIPEPLITVGYFAAGVTTGTRSGGDYVVRPGELILVDMTEPYDMRWPDGFSVFALQLTHAVLGVTPEVAHRATLAAHTSPVYDLVRRHIGRTCASLPSLQGNPAGGALRGVTVDLVRALVASAGAKATEAAEVLEDTLLVRVERWVMEHLGEPSLSPERIASAHFISLRRLYYEWATRDGGESLADWIMSQRLERAARILAATGSYDAAIAAVARRCGFADPAHFARRFRERYGVPPRAWRASHQAGVPLLEPACR
jgi:AraC-like DNA-binding protein